MRIMALRWSDQLHLRTTVDLNDAYVEMTEANLSDEAVAMNSKDVVTYRLDLRNDPEDLQRLIEFGEVLEQEDFPQLNTQGEELIILNYSFINRGASN